MDTYLGPAALGQPQAPNPQRWGVLWQEGPLGGGFQGPLMRSEVASLSVPGTSPSLGVGAGGPPGSEGSGNRLLLEMGIRVTCPPSRTHRHAQCPPKMEAAAEIPSSSALYPPPPLL